MMNIACRLLFYLLISLSLVACSLMSNELKQAETLIETAPDSALSILQHISPSTLKSDKNRALYGLLMIQTLNKKKLPLRPDSLLDFSIEYYKENPDNDRLASAYFYKGRSYKYALQYENAMSFYLKAIDALHNPNNFVLLGRINFDLGDIHNAQRNFILARQKYQIAYECFTKINYKPQAFYALLNIGRTFHSSKNYKSAQVFYKKIYSTPLDSLQKGALLQEIAINFYDDKMLDSAFYYFRKVIQYPNIDNNAAIRYYYLADLFVDLDKADSAYLYAINCFKFNPDIRIQKECYRILVNSANAKGDIAGLKKFMVKYQDCTDSILKIDTQTKGSYIETMHTTKQEVVKTKQWVWNLIVAIFIIIIISVFSYFGLRKRKEKEFVAHQQKHKEEKETLHKEVMLKYSKSLLQKIENRKTEQSEKRKKLTAKEKDALDMQLYNELLHFNDSVYFFKQMDTNLNNLVTKLRGRYTAVSDREICWCCLTLLNIPYPDILLLLNYKTNTLNKMKQRLAIKLQLENAFELVSFLNNILAED